MGGVGLSDIESGHLKLFLDILQDPIDCLTFVADVLE